MDTQQIKALIDVMAASDLDEMEISHDGWTLRLVRRGGGGVRLRSSRGNDEEAVVPAPASVTQGGASAPSPAQHVAAPMFGIVHLQSAPGEAAFVKAGDTIEAGTLVCTIEAMKVFNEVRAEHGGRITAVLVDSGAEVEAGQPLFAIVQARDV
jgi:acetyl-CoA carboxylase biotin carboxyl carrier protein